MNNKAYEKLSKEVSYALRHAPWEYELEIDEQGWVSVEQLLDALQEDVKWENLTEEDLIHMIDKSEKKRHEISNGRIRAFYGHSIPIKIIKKDEKPPKTLYHGTAKRFLKSIIEKGLLPKNRQYVHLSQDVETAIDVGKRHDAKPVILEISALDAWNKGVKFYYGNEKVWLADEISMDFIVIKDNYYKII